MNPIKDNFLEIFNSIDFARIKDHPNILIAARFWDEERYNAAKTCYRFMRAVDDLIDEHKAANKIITPSERIKFTAEVNNWLEMLFVPGNGDSLRKELTETIEKFRIPLWSLEAFARSMLYDINNDGFRTFKDFMEYSQGASVAPASIFVHLNGLIREDGYYREPLFNVRESATPCAIFSYLVHIIRDFQKDQLNNLNYFADDLLTDYGLTRFDLKEIAYGHPPGDNFRNLIKHYLIIADEYRLKCCETIKQMRPLLEPKYQLSLEIIFNLYLLVFEKINIREGNFTTEELNPTSEETRQRVFEIINNFVPVTK
ncbi:MAG: squalene/phytoene synthase family protein [Bacteroidales bacterium]|nr:squalene/phytoene synthase family protein [Bacteroidales bacterium]